MVSVGIPVMRERSEMFCIPTLLTASMSLVRSLVKSDSLGKLPNKRIRRCEYSSGSSPPSLFGGWLRQIPTHPEFAVVAIDCLARDLEGRRLDRQDCRNDDLDGSSDVPAHRAAVRGSPEDGRVAHHYGELVPLDVEVADLYSSPSKTTIGIAKLFRESIGV